MSNRPYAAGEHSKDPTLPHSPHAEVHPIESESVDRWQEPVYKSATGKHHKIRITSTDQEEGLLHLVEGEEQPNPRLSQQEPSDTLPDQQDQNR